MIEWVDLTWILLQIVQYHLQGQVLGFDEGVEVLQPYLLQLKHHGTLITVQDPLTGDDMLTGYYRIRTTALIIILIRYNLILHIRVVL